MKILFFCKEYENLAQQRQRKFQCAGTTRHGEVFMKKVLFIITMFFMVNLFLSGAIIEKIVLEGNKKVSKDTVLFYMKSHENGDFSKNSLKKDFKALWETGFFENIEIKAEDGSNGKIVKVIVKENPLIASVTYKTGKKIKKDDIQEKMRENNVSLMAFSHYSPSKLKKVEKIIRDMLLEKGYNQGKVNVVSKDEKGQVEIQYLDKIKFNSLVRNINLIRSTTK